ncbi:MAG: hypothetical protein R3E32_19520 [Chitinophagales bacterium]
MKKWNFLLMLFFLFADLYGQQVVFSRPQRLPTKVTEYEIIGKTNQGLVVHKSGSKYNEMEMYDLATMKLKWSKEMSLGDKKAKVEKIVAYKDELVIVFTIKEKNETVVYVRRTTPELQPLAEDVELDRIVRKFGTYGFDFFVDVSKNKKYINILRHNFDFSGLDNIDCILVNSRLKVLVKKNIPIEDRPNVLDETFLSNEGIIFFGQGANKRTLLNNQPQYESLKLLKYDYRKEELKLILIDQGEHLMNEVDFEVDDKNGKVIIAGFYSVKQASVSDGYLYIDIDLKTDKIGQRTFAPFSAEFTQKIESLKGYRTSKKVNNLNINELIVRNDGGALIVAESAYSTSRNVTRSAFDTYYNSRRTMEVTNYYNDDIIVLSINPDGSLFWDNVLRKKQYSEDDEGYFSSFGIVNVRSVINLIFNEEITKNTTVNGYVLDAKGDYKIQSLVSVREYDLMMAPQYSKQLSFSEVVLPAFNNRNEFMLAKISF